MLKNDSTLADLLDARIKRWLFLIIANSGPDAALQIWALSKWQLSIPIIKMVVSGKGWNRPGAGPETHKTQKQKNREWYAGRSSPVSPIIYQLPVVHSQILLLKFPSSELKLDVSISEFWLYLVTLVSTCSLNINQLPAHKLALTVEP